MHFYDTSIKPTGAAMNSPTLDNNHNMPAIQKLGAKAEKEFDCKNRIHSQTVETSCGSTGNSGMKNCIETMHLNNTMNGCSTEQSVKEICCGCQAVIEDRFLLKVMSNSWHEKCLQCSICQEPLTRSCYVKDCKLFCKLDYDKYYGTKCNGCLQTISSNELVMRALGNVYHLRCFMCVICGHQLQKGEQFVIKDSQLFCRIDFEKEFALMPLSPKSDWHHDSLSPGSDWNSSYEENDSDTAKGPKRPHTILTTAQRRKFKQSFEITPKPSRKVREALAAETGLSVRVVQVWFQNQRAKVKKLARRLPNDNGDGSNRKTGQKKRKIKDDDDQDGQSVTGSSGYSSLTPLAENHNSQFTPQLSPFDQHPSHNYPPHMMQMGEPMYADDGMPMETSIEGNMEEMMMSQGQPPTSTTTNGHIIHPIDKLYSMQNSYFNSE
ncbi:unnamed protein product [Owenia fusiformis]|uniref:Uncharacterized protein n=1 Tax=Owenia fusiformis TaxID=6347 RepID=A0A8J1TZ61_OWEFU|nr:unnamed protein product [Owenia fusiformis]